jgi:hypothetical protein
VRIAAQVGDADVVAPDHQDIGFVRLVLAFRGSHISSKQRERRRNAGALLAMAFSSIISVAAFESKSGIA